MASTQLLGANGDVFTNLHKAGVDTFSGHGKGLVDDIIDSGSSVDRAFGIGSIGLDLGWINVSAGASGDDNSLSFGVFGAELQLDHNLSNGQLNYNVGFHLGLQIGAGVGIAASYIDSTASLAVIYGAVSTSLSLTRGHLSEGLNFGLVGPATGQDGVGLGYGLNLDSNGNVSGSFNVNVQATNFANKYLGMSGINKAYNNYQKIVNSGLGLFDGGQAIQDAFAGQDAGGGAGGGATYQPNGTSSANPFLPSAYLFTYGDGDVQNPPISTEEQAPTLPDNVIPGLNPYGQQGMQDAVPPLVNNGTDANQFSFNPNYVYDPTAAPNPISFGTPLLNEVLDPSFTLNSSLTYEQYLQLQKNEQEFIDQQRQEAALEAQIKADEWQMPQMYAQTPLEAEYGRLSYKAQYNQPMTEAEYGRLETDSVLMGNFSPIHDALGNILAGAAAINISSPMAAENSSINYGAFDELGRPTGVNAVITQDMIGTGTPANPEIIPPGWSGNGNISNEARGHLLGAQLGGSGDIAENLVTLQNNPANSPIMRGFETSVRNAVENGEVVNYSATPIYEGTNLAPRGITLSGSGSGGFSFNVTVLNPVGQ